MSTQSIYQSTQVTSRTKAFTGQPIAEHTFDVAADGTVRVWDSVAGYFTTCHAISKSAMARIRKMAEKEAMEAGWKVALGEIERGDTQPLKDLKIAE